MLSDVLEDRASLYVSGAMTAAERELFEPLLEFHTELRAHVEKLREAATVLAVASAPAVPAPSARLKDRILTTVRALPPGRIEGEAVVVTTPAGVIEWANADFTVLCGYSLEELKGRKPGPMLQGAGTDHGAVERIRAAVREGRSVRELLVNYHKDGSRYVVDIRIAPVLDEERKPLWFVAKERRVLEAAAAHA